VQPDGVEFRISPVTGYLDAGPDVATLGQGSYGVG